MKVIIVGAHGEAKELINRISSGWSISVIDLDQDKLRNFSTNRQIEKIQGDATSSLVLKKAGLESTTAVITLTLNDEVNLEVLKIAKQNDIFRLSSVVNEASNADSYKNLGAEVVEPDILLARRFEHILEPRRVVSQAFAGGRAEAIEIEISSDSPVRGKKLKEIGSDYYIVGALLRKGKVIIPHGDTEIETGDLVTIVLQSGAFSNVINLFSGSESRYPLEYGKNILVVLENKDNLKNLLTCLRKHKIQIISSGGTYKAIKKLKFKCLEVSDFHQRASIFSNGWTRELSRIWCVTSTPRSSPSSYQSLNLRLQLMS